LKERKKKWEL